MRNYYLNKLTKEEIQAIIKMCEHYYGELTPEEKDILEMTIKREWVLSDEEIEDENLRS